MAQSSNKGVIAVVGGGCVVGLLFALGYLMYWAPKQKAEQARQEIKEWSEAWVAARACLLGETPLAREPGHALSARTLSTQGLHAKLGRCMTSLKALRRAEGFNTEDEAIESAWQTIQIPVSKLAQAQAWIAATEPNKPPETLRENLGKAIAEVDLVDASLRKAGGLSVLAPKGPTLAKSETHKILSGPDKAAFDVSMVRLEANSITYLATDQDSQFRLILSEKEQAFERLSPLALRAVQADWGMWVEFDGIPMPSREAGAGAQVMTGPLDALGEPSGIGTLLHTLKEGEHVALSFAIGDQQRSVLFRIEERPDDYYSVNWSYQLMVSPDSGISYRNEPLPAGELWVSLKASTLGNYLSWQEDPESTSLNMLRLTTSGSQALLLNFAGARHNIRNWPPELCQAPHRSWWVVDGAVYTMGTDSRLVPLPGKVRQDPNTYEQTMRCTDDGFSVSSQQYGEAIASTLLYQTCTLERCSDEIHKVELPIGARYQLVRHQGKWRALVMLDEVVAIWTEGEEDTAPQLASIERSGDIYGAVSWQAGLLLLAWPQDANAPSLIRLP